MSAVPTGRTQNNIKLSARKHKAFTLPFIGKIIIYQSYEQLMLNFRNHISEVSSCHGAKCQDKDLPQRDAVQCGTWITHCQTKLDPTFPGQSTSVEIWILRCHGSKSQESPAMRHCLVS